MASYERHVEHHPCSFEELGLSDKPYQHGHGEDDGLEYPIFWESEHEVRLWKKKFKCMKHEDFVIWGNFNTAKAQQVAISFSICEGEGCYDREKILAWLDTQYIVMLYHQSRFNSHAFFEKTKIQESRLAYVPISSETR